LQEKQKRKWWGIVLVGFLIWASMTPTFQQFTSFPRELRLFSGDQEQLRLTMPATVMADIADPHVAAINGKSRAQLDLHHPFTVMTKHRGQTRLTLRLFGRIPLKTLQVRVLPEIRVIPGGQSIGVKLQSDGVMVVGHHLVSQGDEAISPGEKADIRVGDYIVRINDQPIQNVNQVSSIVRKTFGQPLKVTMVRGDRERETTLTPVFDKREGIYRIGLYIRDSAAGVGTLTFYDPVRKVYGALGHVISDMDTGQPIRVGGGTIIHSSVTSIQKGESGEPGEKRAIFFQEHHVLGSIRRNTPFGIFGKMERSPDKGLYNRTVPVALAEEVKEGPAQILTVVEGQKVERYNIEIVHVVHQKYPATKGMIIKITDPRLLKSTGGIVQGMSGSPILQNGKLIGAVTHVFVNDPTSGYGTLIEWMLQDAGVLQAAGLQETRFSFLSLKEKYGRTLSQKQE
jgi:stage IV sporulation protein B